MKVICIDAKTRNEPCPFVEGQTYTANPKEECIDGCCFMIVESGRKWNKNRFAEVSDLDETTLVNEEFNEKYCVPVNQ